MVNSICRLAKKTTCTHIRHHTVSATTCGLHLHHRHHTTIEHHHKSPVGKHKTLLMVTGGR